jgi:hypothetical protein
MFLASRKYVPLRKRGVNQLSLPQPAPQASMTKRQEHTEKALKEAGW